MKELGLNELREMFLSFFEEKGHLRLPSFSLIPHGDESLLLINSGMAPMKTWFTGEQEPPSKRVCTCQKCIRTGDIDSVGKTSRHGTYFEMLGNFSFGDYFKKEAILWSWEFLTERLELPVSLLYPSVYIDDDEAFDIWANDVKIPRERIIRLGKNDNFWDHGSGPCGPCSEIYYDRGEENGCGLKSCAPGCDCDRFVEIWNNVFTQFDNDGSGNYTELLQKNIDTGMGLERLACVCQGVSSLFEIDTVIGLTQKVSDLCGIAYGASPQTDVSIRIIVDHIRSATMMVCDGVLPSNEGRGYVLRRLLRRAARQGKLLEIDLLFLSDLCDEVISQNKVAYPDLIEKSDYIKKIIRLEEESFSKTIESGLSLLLTLIDSLKAEKKNVLPGDDAFRLYDTYGFPLDMTLDILSEHGMSADTKSFDENMLAQRDRARSARLALGDLAWAGIELGLDSTPTEFVGYESTDTQGKVLAIVLGEDLSGEISEDADGFIVLDKTPFYAESGGQSADIGTISSNSAVFIVTRVVKDNSEKFLHYGKMQSGALSVGDVVTASIDVSNRHAIERAHSATHLLHKVLKESLGDHVNQAGSLVEPDALRFDFTHFSALTKDELRAIEERVNHCILDDSSVSMQNLPIDEAKKIGAVALFGEKYGNIVRVVAMGDSVEFCGGTHISNTAKIGAFAISSEFSVASGVRRIEATTGYETNKSFCALRDSLAVLSGVLKATSTDDLIAKAEQSQQMLREYRSKLEAIEAKSTGAEAADLLAEAENIDGLSVLSASFRNIGAEKLKLMADALRGRNKNVVAVLAGSSDGKITIVACCGSGAVAKGVRAGELVREVTRLCGGSGGGKPDFAMGGAKDESLLADALSAVKELARNAVSK